MVAIVALFLQCGRQPGRHCCGSQAAAKVLARVVARVVASVVFNLFAGAGATVVAIVTAGMVLTTVSGWVAFTVSSLPKWALS